MTNAPSGSDTHAEHSRLRKIGRFLLNILIAKLFWKAIAVVVAFFTVLSPFCVTIVHEYELVVTETLGDVNADEAARPGLHWYWPFINRVYRYDTRPKVYQIISPVEPDKDEKLGIGMRSLDGWHAGAIVRLRYHLNKQKAEPIVANFGDRDSAEARKLIEEAIELQVRSAVQSLAPKYVLEHMRSNRTEFANNVLYILGYPVQPITGSQMVVSQDDDGNVTEKLTSIEIPEPIFGDKTHGDRLADLGIEITFLEVEMDTSSEYDAKMQLLANLVLDEQHEIRKQRLTDLELQSVAKQSELEEKRVEQKAKEIETLLRARDAVSPVTQFCDKWDGKLPHAIVASPEWLDLLKFNTNGPAKAE